jgi:hypothetical protein
VELIGLSGYARSGKDEAAKVLVEEFGFKRVAFADKLREVLYQLNPVVDILHGEVDIAEVHTPISAKIRVQDVINHYGWDGYKTTPYGVEVRRLLQRLGTEAGRKTLWDSIWIDAALTGLDEGAKIVVTDCRFPNEAQAIQDNGGRLWRIERDGIGPANAHPSETSLDDWRFDAWITNGSTLEHYHQTIRYAYEEFYGKV